MYRLKLECLQTNIQQTEWRVALLDCRLENKLQTADTNHHLQVMIKSEL